MIGVLTWFFYSVLMRLSQSLSLQHEKIYKLRQKWFLLLSYYRQELAKGSGTFLPNILDKFWSLRYTAPWQCSTWIFFWRTNFVLHTILRNHFRHAISCNMVSRMHWGQCGTEFRTVLNKLLVFRFLLLWRPTVTKLHHLCSLVLDAIFCESHFESAQRRTP